MGSRDAGENLLGGPPGVDPIAMARTRAAAEAKLFGKTLPARIGRYEVTSAIGSGGMGVVYGAVDPKLERKVALKVLHPLRNHDPRSQHRMISEARSLAKLDHPNIVKVHDVLLEGDQVVLVMELLDGETLERWQSRDRGPEEIVAAYAQASDALAAAHRLGVVHRDFKPSNAIISKDGRVRVLDFGLAHSETPESETGQPDHKLTGSGLVGTLVYASPEQLAGLTVTSASDQFNFCVALHTAIEGVSPFEGIDPVQRLANIQRVAPALATDGRRVPVWLRALIARGLSPTPADRHDSMDDVSRELRRVRGWRRWRTPLAVGTTLGIAVATTAVLARGGAAEPCGGASSLVGQVWNATFRSQIAGALDRIGSPYALEVRERLVSALDRYAMTWQGAHELVCQANQRGETSPILLDRKMTCMSRRLGDLRAAVSVLVKVDSKSLPQVMDVASAIPSVAPCLDSELMQADVDPPDTLELRTLIEQVRSEISEAEALSRAGRAEAATSKLAAARRVAESAPYAPIKVDVALAEGRILLARNDLEGAIKALTAARDLGFEQRMLSAAIEASARQIYAEGAISPRVERLEGEIQHLLPLSAGLRGDHFIRPLLLNNIGTVYVAAGRRIDASRYFEQAKREVLAHDPNNLELTSIDLNLAMITSDASKREALARSVWEKRRASLGEQHLSTLDARTAYAVYVANPTVAFESLAAIVATYERFHPWARRAMAHALSKAAFLASDLEQTDRSSDLYRRAIGLVDGDDDVDVSRWRPICEGELALETRDPARAIEVLQPVVDKWSQSANWWERADALRAQVGLGQAAMMRGDLELAIRLLEAVIRDFPSVIAMNEEVENRRYLARAKHILSHALTKAGREAPRAKALDEDARSFYRTAGYNRTFAVP